MPEFVYRGVALGRAFERIPTDPALISEARSKLLRYTDEKRVYFAHPQPTYGTEQEKEYILAIQANFPGAVVVNPGDLGEIKIRDMGFYLDIVKACDILVYTRLRGAILGGVGLEVDFAMGAGKEVYELEGTSLTQIHEVPKYLDREETVALLKEVGFRK